MGSWVVMMPAMMLPSLLVAVAASAGRVVPGATARLGLFGGGYLGVWAAAGLLAYGMHRLVVAALGGALAWHAGGRWASAAAVALAAVYELLPVKRACLTRCRRAGDLASGPRRPLIGPAAATAAAAGVRNGLWCVGASWALMAALFALGGMNLTWMVLLAGLVALQKAGAWPRPARLVAALLLAAVAIGVVVAPGEVPGLMVPGSPPGHAMSAMG